MMMEAQYFSKMRNKQSYKWLFLYAFNFKKTTTINVNWQHFSKFK